MANSHSPVDAGPSDPVPVPTLPEAAARIVPGVLVATAVAGAAFVLREVPHLSALSPLILAILIGMFLRNVFGTPAVLRPGIAFSMRRILRAGIVLLGLQLTIAQVVAVGGTGVLIIAATLAATFLVTLFLGRLLGVDQRLTELIAAGTSICGASAVIASNAVTQGRDEDVAYAVACVTVFGSISMFAYPLLGTWLGLDAHAYGLWAGASIHEVAQVVAAAYQHGTSAGEFGTIAKLTRVMMLAPTILILGAAVRRRRVEGNQGTGRGSAPIPWFVLGFIVMVGIASSGVIPSHVQTDIAAVTTFLLAMALAAMGLETDIRKIAGEGVRPLLLAALAWGFIGAFSLALIAIVGG